MSRRRGKCARPNCPNAGHTRGLCRKHYGQWHRARIARGEYIPGLVDAAETRQHIDALSRAGVGARRIAELTGIHRDVIFQTRQHGTVYANTAARILAIPIPDAPHQLAAGGARISTLGTARRLQALVAAGHTQRDLADRLGMIETNLVKYFKPDRLINAATARRVDALFRELQLVPGASKRAMARAKRNGWAPPLAWTEEAIDDPAGTPALDAIPEPGHSRRVPDDFVAIVEDHRHHVGRTDAEIAELLGLTLEAFQRRLSRLGGAA